MSAQGISSADAYQLTKAQLSNQEDLAKTDTFRQYLAKRQMRRNGIGDGYYRLKGRTVDGKPPGTVVKADGRVRTIYDLIDYYYGFMPEYYKQVNKNNSVTSTGPASQGVLDPAPGYRNVIYGSEVFSLVNSEPNIFALLENRAWTKSGERALTEHGHDPMGQGGVGENATIGAGEDIETDHPPLTQFEQDPETIAHSFDVSQEKQLLAMTQDDDLDDPFDFLRRWYGEGTQHQTGMGEHPKHMNVQLGRDADDDPDAIYDGDTGVLHSIDQAISNEEETDFMNWDAADTYTGANLYGFDRTDEEFESNVVHNNGDPLTFTTDILDDMIRVIKTESGRNPVTDENYFFLTNHDTYQRIENEVGGKERLEPQRVSIGLRGVESNPGQDVGITVSAYKQIPIFESVDIPQDDLGRVYLIDSTTMFLKTLLPTQFYSTGTEVDNNPWAIGRMGNQGLYATIAQLTLVNPAAHAKARDLA